ncbi:MAG: hypothetical protein J7647_20560 [Cyanobacteria bacterium SBLK]|nr:hypothetical protein [Cyanobacteria bacterium SBLK]
MNVPLNSLWVEGIFCSYQRSVFTGLFPSRCGNGDLVALRRPWCFIEMMISDRKRVTEWLAMETPILT